MWSHSLKVFFTQSLNLFVRELAQLTLNPTKFQFATLLPHGKRQFCSPVHPRPSVWCQCWWLVRQERCVFSVPEGFVEEVVKIHDLWRIPTRRNHKVSGDLGGHFSSGRSMFGTERPVLRCGRCSLRNLRISRWTWGGALPAAKYSSRCLLVAEGTATPPACPDTWSLSPCSPHKKMGRRPVCVIWHKKTFTLGESLSIPVLTRGASVPHMRTLRRLTFSLKWNTLSSLKVRRVEKPSSFFMRFWILQQELNLFTTSSFFSACSAKCSSRSASEECARQWTEAGLAHG